jgi:hypothetical protein
MLKKISEAEGLEGWQQAKITKAADYISSVYHSLDYDMQFGEQVKEGLGKATCGCTPDSCSHCSGKHTLEEVGQKCSCCGNKITEVKDDMKESLSLALEKAVSKAQQRFMGMAHAMQKGEKIKGASPELKKVAKDMKKSDTKDFAKTKHKGLPDKKTDESGLQRYTGIKKYGKKGFEELQKAGREGASEEEKGAIKDKYLKKK